MHRSHQFARTGIKSLLPTAWAHTRSGQCFLDTVLLQVKGAAGDVADKSGAGDAADKAGGVLQNAQPKRGLFERINDEALTKNAPSVQQGQKS